MKAVRYFETLGISSLLFGAKADDLNPQVNINLLVDGQIRPIL